MTTQFTVPTTKALEDAVAVQQEDPQAAGGITLDHAYLLTEPALPVTTAPSSPSPAIVRTGTGELATSSDTLHEVKVVVA